MCRKAEVFFSPIVKCLSYNLVRESIPKETIASPKVHFTFCFFNLFFFLISSYL